MPRPLFVHLSLLHHPHSFTPSPLSESQEQASRVAKLYGLKFKCKYDSNINHLLKLSYPEEY